MTKTTEEVTCQLCGRICKSTKSLAKHLKYCKNNLDGLTPKEYYHKYINPDATGKCNHCGKDVNFINCIDGYYHLCDPCNKKDPGRMEKIHKTLNEGGGIGMARQSTKQKIKQTMLDNYGADNASRVSELMEKRTESRKSNPNIGKNISEGLKKSTIGVGSASEKYKQTCLEKFGSTNVLSSDYGKEAIQKARDEKFEGKHHMCTDSIKEKVKQTCLEKYGVSNVLQTEWVKEKTKESGLKKALQRRMEQNTVMIEDDYQMTEEEKKNWEIFTNLDLGD
jgi:hypothetical protein